MNKAFLSVEELFDSCFVAPREKSSMFAIKFTTFRTVYISSIYKLLKRSTTFFVSFFVLFPSFLFNC